MIKEQRVIYIVGMGPGDVESMTKQAYSVLESCDTIVGYTVYVELMKTVFPDKEYVTTPMRQEVERCKLCFELAQKGKRVAMICSGDAGVYGMAAPMYELYENYRTAVGEAVEEAEKIDGIDNIIEDVELVVVPGITAANSGAALLGAPLNHDYCVISLSDLLTPWELIEKRLQAAVFGDFSIAIYNPSSHKRRDYLEKACDILLQAGASPDRACGYVENIGREGTKTKVMTLQELRDTKVNMFTTVFVGNSKTRIVDHKLVTPRGYQV